MIRCDGIAVLVIIQDGIGCVGLGYFEFDVSIAGYSTGSTSGELKFSKAP